MADEIKRTLAESTHGADADHRRETILRAVGLIYEFPYGMADGVTKSIRTSLGDPEHVYKEGLVFTLAGLGTSLMDFNSDRAQDLIGEIFDGVSNEDRTLLHSSKIEHELETYEDEIENMIQGVESSVMGRALVAIAVKEKVEEFTRGEMTDSRSLLYALAIVGYEATSISTQERKDFLKGYNRDTLRTQLT